MRLRAIACALWFGILPWWIYESKCHHAGEGYLAHLLRNLCLAARWATWREDLDDWAFEIRTNGSPNWHRWMRRRRA